MKDANEEMWTIFVKGFSGAYTSGSVGGTANEIPTSIGNAAATSVGEIDNTTVAAVGSGAEVTHCIFNWNIRVPFDYFFLPETRLRAAPTDALVIGLATTPTAATIGGTCFWREL